MMLKFAENYYVNSEHIASIGLAHRWSDKDGTVKPCITASLSNGQFAESSAFQSEEAAALRLKEILYEMDGEEE